jgi:hypothetical protein
MKKSLILAVAAIVMASCCSDELVNKPTTGETPIAFSVEKANITRAKNLEETGHYNFGVWAYKYGTGLNTQQVMGNYLVGYCNENDKKGYEHSGSSTWNQSAGNIDDHKSPWFYENLGTAEYTYNKDDGYYKKDQNDYMSANTNQYLRYWDLKYTTTNFYAYAPYKADGVTFDETNKKITVAHAAQKAGYDDASLNEFMYASASSTNANQKDVELQFKHLGAQVNLRFYEDVRGYKVEIIDVTTSGTGIQATPATKNGDTYTKAGYYTECGATIDFNTVTTPTATVNHTDAATTQENLIFKIPNSGLTSYNEYNVIPESINDPTNQTYASSPTTYYPVAQPTTSEVGFTFHVSYKLIAEDNGEEIIVKNARVFVPAKSGSEFIAAWQPNTKYTYTFKITKDSTGSTNPDESNITDPTVPATPTVYPIVFDGATIEDYTENVANY